LAFSISDVVQSQLQARRLGEMTSTWFSDWEANDSVTPNLI
jgi:hypothetical protein